MTNRRKGRRHSPQERIGDGREWQRRGSNYREETSAQHRRNALQEERREENVGGWGDTQGVDYGPSSTAASKRRPDVRGRPRHPENYGYNKHAPYRGIPCETETETKGRDGWGAISVDNNASADLSTAWEAIASSGLSDWSKPPQIESVEHWDDTAAKEIWEMVQNGHLPVNNPDLYLEQDIDWNFKIPPDLLASVDDRNRSHKASHPRSRSPVLLGLETLVTNWGNDQPQGRGGKEGRSLFHQSKEKLEQGGGSGSWGAMNQTAKPSGYRATKQHYPEQVLDMKRNILMRDDYKDRGLKRRGGLWQVHLPGFSGSQLSPTDEDDFRRKPRFPTTHRY